MNDTIYALSSGRPPAAIGVIRVSGPQARATCAAIAGSVPPARTASLRRLRDADGATLDHALVLFFPGPATATGEDLLELHIHGGRAVAAAVEAALAKRPGLRLAAPGEFTRRALENGRIDLPQAEGLADLLEAETEGQRRAALASSEGLLSDRVRGWMGRLSLIAARVEAELDFAEEGDVVGQATYDFDADMVALAADMNAALDTPSVERLRDGPLVVLAGPPNAGKSSLFNAMLQREAAIVTPIAGTTRDVLEASVVRNGQPFRLVDTAGLASDTNDAIEQIGIDRARSLLQQADLVLWMGHMDDAPSGSLVLAGKADLHADAEVKGIPVSAFSSASVAALWNSIERRVDVAVTGPDGVALRQRQRHLIEQAVAALLDQSGSDPLIAAEQLRIALRRLGEVLGVDATEAMMDALFGRFCLGK